MQDLNPTQYGEADAGRSRRAERLFVRRNCRSRLSKIICGVIFYETVCKADAPAPARAVDSPTEAAKRSNFRLPIASTALGSSSGTPWTILSQGKQICRRRSLI
jgi:hypothetical protein